MLPEDARHKRAGSDASPQREAQDVALGLIAAELGLPGIQPERRFRLGQGHAIVDAFAETPAEVFLIEVNARVGSRMKTATRNKVLKDAFKMLAIAKRHRDAWQDKSVRKVLVFLDNEARASFGAGSWARQAFEDFGIETHVCSVPDYLHQALVAAQIRQDLRVDG